MLKCLSINLLTEPWQFLFDFSKSTTSLNSNVKNCNLKNLKFQRDRGGWCWPMEPRTPLNPRQMMTSRIRPRDVYTMPEWIEILFQLGRDRFQTTGKEWIHPQKESTVLRLISDKPDTPTIHIPKIKKQVRKRTPLTQSIRDQVSENSVLLSDNLVCRTHK